MWFPWKIDFPTIRMMRICSPGGNPGYLGDKIKSVPWKPRRWPLALPFQMDVTSIVEGITPDTKGIFAFSLGCAAVLVAMAQHPEAFANVVTSLLCRLLGMFPLQVKFLICASGNLPQNPTLVEEIEKSSLVKTVVVFPPFSYHLPLRCL